MMTRNLRVWQEECLASLEAKQKTGVRDFLNTATPGAGKTTFALAAAKAAAATGQKIVVVVPSRHLKRQWVKAGHSRGVPLSRKFDNDTLDNVRYVGVPSDILGFVVTYAQVANNPYVFAAICSRYRIFAILDEIHHASQEKSWGTGLSIAFGEACFRLCLSGTPFRSDNQTIPFITYSEGRSQADFNYGYADAVRDNVCRQVLFPVYEGTMQWIDERGTHNQTFEDELDATGDSRRLRTALAVDGSFLPEVIHQAHTRLMQIRSDGHPKAGGLIVAIDQNHANEIAALVRRKLGVDPVVATSDDPEASQKIETFSHGSDQWLIAVRMVSEGVDIPRLRVGVYATTTRRELTFRQVVGRFVRCQSGLEEQTSYIYLPRDRQLVEMARQIQKEIDSVLIETVEREKIERESGPRLINFIPVGSEARAGETILHDGTHMSESELMTARNLRSMVPGMEKVPDHMVALLLRVQAQQVQGGMIAVASEVTMVEEPILDRDTVVASLGKKINKLVNRIANTEANGLPLGEMNKKIHNKTNKMVGIKAGTKHATADQLEAKLEVLQEMLKQMMETNDLGA